MAHLLVDQAGHKPRAAGHVVELIDDRFHSVLCTLLSLLYAAGLFLQRTRRALNHGDRLSWVLQARCCPGHCPVGGEVEPAICWRLELRQSRRREHQIYLAAPVLKQYTTLKCREGAAKRLARFAGGPLATTSSTLGRGSVHVTLLAV